MTQVYPSEIATQMLQRRKKNDFTTRQDPEGRSIGHMWWMLEQLQPKGKIYDHDKAQRWLGYAQGMMVVYGVATLDELRELNRTGKW